MAAPDPAPATRLRAMGRAFAGRNYRLFFAGQGVSLVGTYPPAGGNPMKRKSFENDACPLARSLEAVEDAWSVLIVREAFAGRRRFGEFEQALGIAKNILTVRLRKLVALGVLEQVEAGGRHE